MKVVGTKSKKKLKRTIIMTVVMPLVIAVLFFAVIYFSSRINVVSFWVFIVSLSIAGFGSLLWLIRYSIYLARLPSDLILLTDTAVIIKDPFSELPLGDIASVGGIGESMDGKKFTSFGAVTFLMNDGRKIEQANVENAIDVGELIDGALAEYRSKQNNKCE